MPLPLHIVLVEPSGEIVFEGDSVLRAPPPLEDEEDDSGPPTLRSAA